MSITICPSPLIFCLNCSSPAAGSFCSKCPLLCKSCEIFFWKRYGRQDGSTWCKFKHKMFPKTTITYMYAIHNDDIPQVKIKKLPTLHSSITMSSSVATALAAAPPI